MNSFSWHTKSLGVVTTVLAILCTIPIAGQADDIAFVNVNVVPMDRERVLAAQTVLITAGRIKALGPARDITVPPGVRRVDGSGKYLMRWGDTEQPAVRKAKDPFASLIDLNTVPFRIGETHELNIAVKHPEQAWFYAFDNSTFDFPNWENPAYKLTEREYRVTVRLRGGHLDDEQHFIVRNLGVGNGLEIEVARP